MLITSTISCHTNISGLADYANDDEWFNRAWKPFFEYVVRGVRAQGYKVIGNCAGQYASESPYQDWQRSILDGTVYEQWAVDYTDWLPGSVIERRIDSFSQDPLEAWTADYGIQDPSDPLFDQKSVAALAMYYVALPDSPAMRANKSYNHGRCNSVFWEPIWDFYIGEPAEPRAQTPGKYFWSRRFTKGIVLLNYEATETVTFELDRTYMDPTGNMVSGSINVRPHTGVILACD